MKKQEEKLLSLIKKSWVLREEEILSKCNFSLDKRVQIRITYFDQRCFNIAYNNKEYQTILHSIFTVYIDSFGMRWATKMLFGIKPQIFNSTDLNQKLLKIFADKKKKIFIIGGNFSKENIEQFEKKIRTKIIGYESGYFNDDKVDKIIEKINLLNPSVIIVGMGVPKQEIFVKKIYNKVNASVILCVGNFLEFFIGTKKRAPDFLINSGFEWLFRLISEPKRLWKRYLIGIPIFIFRIIILKIKNKRVL